VCSGTPKTDYTTFGAIDGKVATKATVQGGTFPITRGLYNIYNNTTAAVPASEATLNFIGENGFLCKSSTDTSANELDPITQVPYRTEIENVITANGFFPLDTSPATTFPEGSPLAHGTVTDPAYTAIDNNAGNTGATGNGYCLVTTGV
jgi:hypothetical protein